MIPVQCRNGAPLIVHTKDLKVLYRNSYCNNYKTCLRACLVPQQHRYNSGQAIYQHKVDILSLHESKCGHKLASYRKNILRNSYTTIIQA